MKNFSFISVLLLLLLNFANSQAANITVNATTGDIDGSDGLCSISEAIQAANTNLSVNECPSGNGADTIELTTDITLTTAQDVEGSYGHTGLPVISSPIILNGNGYSIVRDYMLTCNLGVNYEPGEFRLMRIGTSGDMVLNNVTLSNGCADGDTGNTQRSQGGAIYNSGQLSIANSQLSENKASDHGGGIFNAGTITSIHNTTFSKGSSRYGNGGGIYNDNTINTIQNSTFSENLAKYDGGGIYNDNTINTIQNSTFSENSAYDNSIVNHGGGLFNSGLLSKIENITFSGNSANIGGAIMNEATITTIQNSTFSGNTAGTNGSAIDNNQTISVMRNTLFHDNIGGGDECRNGSFAFNGSNNMSDDATGNCPGALFTLLTPGSVGQLGNNGGPTMTHALLPGSEALNRADGDATATDQRGYAAFNGRDLGAYERQQVEDVIFRNGFE